MIKEAEVRTKQVNLLLMLTCFHRAAQVSTRESAYSNPEPLTSKSKADIVP